MDKFALAARKYVIDSEAEDKCIIEKGMLHVSYVDTWRGYRLYDYYIEGRLTNPVYPPVYIMVDQCCKARMMTQEESFDYMKDMNMCLRKAVMWMEHQMRNEQN